MYKADRKKVKRNLSVGEIKVYATFNNVIISLVDQAGNVIKQSSSGAVGASGPKKSSSYYASMVINKVLDFAYSIGVRVLSVTFKGPGINARDSVVKALSGSLNKFAISFLRDITPVPHNGCRPRKRRRV